MVAEAGSASSARRWARTGSSETSAAAGSSMTATSNMAGRLVPTTFLVKEAAGRWTPPAILEHTFDAGGRHVRRRRPRGHRQPRGALPPPLRGARRHRGARAGPGDGPGPVLAPPPRRAGTRPARRPPAGGTSGPRRAGGASADGPAPAGSGPPRAGTGAGAGGAAARPVRGPAAGGDDQGPGRPGPRRGGGPVGDPLVPGRRRRPRRGGRGPGGLRRADAPGRDRAPARPWRPPPPPAGAPRRRLHATTRSASPGTRRLRPAPGPASTAGGAGTA